VTGLVFELQRDSLDSEIRVSSLLRKALVVSKKLGVIEIEEWLKKELDGYLSTDDIPKYREVRGEVRVWNPYHGWQPLNFPSAQMAQELSVRDVVQSVGELDSLSESGEHTMQIPFSQDIVNLLMKAMRVPLQPSLLVDKTEIIGILDAVRNNILNWSLELEQKGILGEGMSFSNEEKKIAHRTTYQVTNNIGSMHNSQLQQDSSGSTQSLHVVASPDNLHKFIEELKHSIESLKLQQEQTQELKEAIATLEIQANSSKPKNVIINESLDTIRNILEGTTGSIVASGLIYQLGLFLS